MKFKFICILLFIFNSLNAQQYKETVIELSKNAKKGILTDVGFADNDKVFISFDMKVDKKSDELASEDYVFDRNLSFLGIQPSKSKKEIKPNTTLSKLVAFVGGTNSFNVMSMKLNLQQEEWELVWNYKKQKYEYGKRLSKETVKPKNNDSKYIGYASFSNENDGSVLVVASYDNDKVTNTQYVVLNVSNDLTLKETVIPIKGNYSLVHCGVLHSGNIFVLLAPDKGMPDLKKYVISEFKANGNLLYSSEFIAPSSNTLVMDYTEVNGDIVFAGGSDKSNDAFNQVFTDYAPIENPGYTTGANRQMDKYERRAYGERFDNFHIFRLSNGRLVFSGTTPASEFKLKVINPPSQKRSTPYEGKAVTIKDFTQASNGDYLIALQMKEKKITKNSYEYRFYDYICMQFDKFGTLKAQYAAEKFFNDKKNELYSSPQHFIISNDKNVIYWELMEAKVVSFYATFSDAYFGNKSYQGHYFPRIAKINLESKKITEFDGLGENGKFLVYKNYRSIYDEISKTIFYFGHDEDYEKLWIGKYNFK